MEDVVASLAMLPIVSWRQGLMWSQELVREGVLEPAF